MSEMKDFAAAIMIFIGALFGLVLTVAMVLAFYGAVWGAIVAVAYVVFQALTGGSLPWL